jgi:hypothetical protein
MSTSVFPLLEVLRDELATVPGVVSAKVGIEANMTADDYPMIRIEPSAIRYGGLTQTRAVDVLIYFGTPVHEFTTDLQGLLSDLMGMESAILTKLESSQVVRFDYDETVADEGRVDGYRLMAIRGAVEG